METIKTSQVRRNDVILCPATGREETVLFNRRGAAGRRFIRTNQHDHNRLPSAPVTLVSRYQKD